MKFSKKETIKISVIYALILVFANILGILISSTIEKPGGSSESMSEWLRFMNDYRMITDPIQFLTFIIPTIFCFWYTKSVKISDERLERRLINLPIAYSTIGVLGWLVYFAEEVILLLVVNHLDYQIQAKHILSSSIFYITSEATVTFTLAYFLMDLLHKKWFFPSFYPNGEFIGIKGLKHPSVKFLCRINYVSVTLFPLALLLESLYSISMKNNIQIGKQYIFVFFLVFLIGLVISTTFYKNFEKPLAMLKARIEKIKQGDFSSRVGILGNDDFGELGAIFNDMTSSIDSQTKKIQEIQNSVIEGMAIMVESRDNSTGGHIKRTSDCVRIFVNSLKNTEPYKKYSDSFYQSVVRAAPMHDLGKIAVDDAVLRKPGKFTDEEYEKMKAHSKEGARIVEEVIKPVENEEFKKIAINIAHFHHEKWNGQGYPGKLSGNQIPFEARIMALADVFDALVSRRCYKDSFSYDKAFQIIEESLGSHFDSELGKIFIQCRPQLEELYNTYQAE